MTALFLVLLLVLVAINGLFVAAEFALVRARKGRIEALAAEGEAGAEQALEQIETIDESLSACQVGITMASIGIGFLGERALVEIFEPLLDGPLAHGVATPIAFILAYTLATSLHITVGEQVPKILAITNADRTARALSKPLRWFEVASAPFTMALTQGLERDRAPVRGQPARPLASATPPRT